MTRARYQLDPVTSRFVIENYNWASPFSNFLPGIAGLWGIPLWLYYVNRGQAVSSFGVRDKNGQILEFYSFNKATMRVAREGFRTFIRVDGAVHEPFVKTPRDDVHQTMIVSASEIVLREVHDALALEVEVAYFPLPNMRIAGLAREVRIRNRGAARDIECIDGLPRILPYGLDQTRIKNIPRHIEGMMGVVDCGGVPMYRLKQTADDSEQVAKLSAGHFYLGQGSIVVDPEAVFGEPMSYDRPWQFEQGGIAAVLAAPQFGDNKAASAFSAFATRLDAGGEHLVSSVIGYARDEAELAAMRPSLESREFLAAKREENTAVIDEIADRAFTVSSSPAFDAYVGQTFLDNVVRGGMPLMFDTARGRRAFYVYSRQNGDLERDYHFFVLDPTYLSQGTGHYRSVLQNRRTDGWFFPETEHANLETFLGLIQLDGYNPLEVCGSTYQLVDAARAEPHLTAHVPDPGARDTLRTWMQRSFTPGELAMRLEAHGPAPTGGWLPVVAALLACSRELEIGALHEGFWVDHWHYNIDLLEMYLMIYPDRLREVLLERGTYTYFDDPDVILPRAERSVDAGGKIRMYGAVVRDPDKQKRIRARADRPYTVRTQHGEGEIYETNLLVKLMTIVVNRLATLDAAGTGIEMEAGKPGWNDSMNGLPGLFGSGLSETLELVRTVDMLVGALASPALADAPEVAIYDELATFMRQLAPLLRQHGQAYWDAATTLKERYREATKLGIAGTSTRVPLAELRQFLTDAKAKLDAIFDGPTRAATLSPDGVPYTYFVNDVVEARPTGKRGHGGLPAVEPRAFRQRPTKLFLEGAVHWMKARRHEAPSVYQAVRGSAIFDSKLGMYKSCESMEGESYELGRAVGAYPRGWIENESIYLHMEYKYLLEILRAGLCDEFWRDAKSALIPFMDPEVYGRSTLEGASFIVSSAYADPRLHGRAFQPRLSGITCEMLHIWILAVAGEHPFALDGDGLALQLAPRLPGWLFTEQACERRYRDRERGWRTVEVPANAFAFKFLDRALVVYHNAKRASTYGSGGVAPVEHIVRYRDGRTVTVAGARLGDPHARAVRDGAVERIDVTLG